MSAKKLFASDFDGTLNEPQSGVTKISLDAIERFRSEGNVFGIVTGRNTSNISDIYETLRGKIDFVMPMTGALALDGEGNRLFDIKGDGKILPELFRCIAGDDPCYLSWADMYEVFDVDISVPLDEDSPDIKEARRHVNFSQVNTKFFTAEALQRGVEHMTRLFGDKINPQINGLYLDIPPAGVSKGASVAKIAEFFGVLPQNIFTAGDNVNDISMLKAHYGFSVPWAVDPVRASAKEILPGVGDMLLKIMN